MDVNMNNPWKLSEQLNTANKKVLSDIIRYFLSDARSEELSMLTYCATELREKYYCKKVYFRGLIEFSSFCKNDCYYCGLQRSNSNARRYRLNEDDILDCCTKGYKLGFRTFVLQSGEDMFYTDERQMRIVSRIKQSFPDYAVTLSIGERSCDSFKKLFEAGAERYLLRHETANETHYRKLHSTEQSLKNRIQCLYDLKKIGYQVGAGFMVDSPYQTYETLADSSFTCEGSAAQGSAASHNCTRYHRSAWS